LIGFAGTLALALLLLTRHCSNQPVLSLEKDKIMLTGCLFVCGDGISAS
jgi:hypothetical protein